MHILIGFHRFFIVSLYAGALSAVAQTASSSALEEVVVTGDFRGRTDQNLPASITLLDTDEINRRVARHLEEVLAVAPNVQMTAGASRARFYHIRGIGERDQYASPANNSVGLLIDDVDFSAAGAAATLFDVAQVEVLRGPQGTRYGAGALAGLLNVTTIAPSLRTQGYVEQTIANYDSLSTGVAIGGPIKPARLLYRVAAQKNRSDGFIRNRHLGRRNTNEIDELTVRAKLRWFLYEDLRLDLHLGHVHADNGYDAFSLANNRTTLADRPGRDEQRSRYGGINVRWDLTQVSLAGLANFSHSAIDYGYDEDWVFDGFHADGYNSVDRYQRNRRTRSLEMRFVSQPDSMLFNSARWVAGLYWFEREVHLARNHTFTDPLSSDYETSQAALYIELDTDLSPSLVLSVGARAERWQAKYADTASAAFDPDETLWGGRLSLNYRPTASGFWYVSLARGYKASGFNTDGTLASNLRRFDSEVLYSVETGLKYQLPDGRLSGALSLFHMEREDPQISSSVAILQAGSMAPAEFIEFVDNSARGFNRGLELSVHFQPSAHWRLSGQLGLLQTEYSRFTRLEQAADGGLTPVINKALDGRDQAQAPNWQYALAVQRHFANWSLHFEQTGGDGYYFSDSHSRKSDSRHLSHARLSYSRHRWSFSAWMRNILDENVQVHGFYFGNDPEIGYEERVYTQLGEPRRFGVSLRFDFGE